MTCPCCHAQLQIDATLRKVVSSSKPPRHAPVRDLDHATQLLERDAAERNSHFDESAEEEKLKPQLLERKFEEALKLSKGTPPTRPLRDLDLD